MKFAIPFPLLKPEESFEGLLSFYLPFRRNIEHFYFRIPFIEGRDNSSLGRLYADKCREFIRLAGKYFNCVLDVKFNSSRPSINRYYRSNYVPSIIDKFGFNGIIVRDIGNLGYFSDNFQDLKLYYLTNYVDEQILSLLQRRIRLSGLIGVGTEPLAKVEKKLLDFSFRYGYIVNETRIDNCVYRSIMYSGRVGLNGFCNDCCINDSLRSSYCVSSIQLNEDLGNVVDFAVISGALRDSVWINDVFLYYFYRKKLEFHKVLNGPMVGRFYGK